MAHWRSRLIGRGRLKERRRRHSGDARRFDGGHFMTRQKKSRWAARWSSGPPQLLRGNTTYDRHIAVNVDMTFVVTIGQACCPIRQGSLQGSSGLLTPGSTTPSLACKTLSPARLAPAQLGPCNEKVGKFKGSFGKQKKIKENK